jgi:hypothetical protein
MKFAISLSAMTTLSVGAAHAQVDLSTYADANGNLDIQKLTCAQLADRREPSDACRSRL